MAFLFDGVNAHNFFSRTTKELQCTRLGRSKLRQKKKTRLKHSKTKIRTPFDTILLPLERSRSPPSAKCMEFSHFVRQKNVIYVKAKCAVSDAFTQILQCKVAFLLNFLLS